MTNQLISEEEVVKEELSEATQDNETAETIHSEVAEINEPVKDTFIARFEERKNKAAYCVDVKTWQIPKHKKRLPIFNRRALEKSEYARLNGHGMYLPPQAIEHKYFTNMNTQSLNELEAIEQRLNKLIAEAPDIVIKAGVE